MEIGLGYRNWYYLQLTKEETEVFQQPPVVSFKSTWETIVLNSNKADWFRQHVGVYQLDWYCVDMNGIRIYIKDKRSALLFFVRFQNMI